MDTGSSWLWVETDDCRRDDYLVRDQCSATAFHKIESKSYQDTGRSKFIKYGVGSITGSISTDTVGIAGFNALEFDFIAAQPFVDKA